MGEGGQDTDTPPRELSYMSVPREISVEGKAEIASFTAGGQICAAEFDSESWEVAQILTSTDREKLKF